MHNDSHTTEVQDQHAAFDAAGPDGGDRKPPYVFEVDGKDYGYDRPTITGAQIMDLARISASDGLVQILPDGATKTILPDDVVHLASRSHFKSRPRFKRG